jgi:hypothetical protein
MYDLSPVMELYEYSAQIQVAKQNLFSNSSLLRKWRTQVWWQNRSLEESRLVSTYYSSSINFIPLELYECEYDSDRIYVFSKHLK